MDDIKILEDSTKGVDEVLLYKQGKRSGPQMRNFIVRMMKKAREDERRTIREAKNT